jgi:ssDNA-binding Zn-finger/Zn-ribbon topoisomerase 1
MKFKCQACGSNMRIRDSKKITEVTRSVYYECTNSDCKETRSGTHSIGPIVQPSLKAFTQMSVDLLMSSLPEHKRESVLKIINSP